MLRSRKRTASSAVRLVRVADSAESRAAFRRWAREHHPDVGGDPDVFAAGVKAAREGRWEAFAAAATAPAAESVEIPYAREDPLVPENRVEVYVQRSARGAMKIYTVARRWNTKRKLPPRVN
jgi:transposase-like protein